MYGLSKETDLSFLLRKRLERVDISDYQAQLHFDGGVSISIEGTCEIDRKVVDFPQLRSLLGGSVFGVTVQNEGTVNIVFDDARRLSILDSNEEFESYQITGPGVNIVV